VAARSGPAGAEPGRGCDLAAVGLGYAGLGLACLAHADPTCSGPAARLDRAAPGLSGPASSGPVLAGSALWSARVCLYARRTPTPHPACLRLGSAAPWVHADPVAPVPWWTRAVPARPVATDFAYPAPGRRAAWPRPCSWPAPAEPRSICAPLWAAPPADPPAFPPMSCADAMATPAS